MFLLCMFFVCLLQDSILAVFEGDGLPSTPLLSFTNNLFPFLHLDTLLSPLIHIPPYHLLSSVTSFPHTLPFSLRNYAVSLLSMLLYYWLSYTFLQQVLFMPQQYHSHSEWQQLKELNKWELKHIHKKKVPLFLTSHCPFFEDKVLFNFLKKKRKIMVCLHMCIFRILERLGMRLSPLYVWCHKLHFAEVAVKL